MKPVITHCVFSAIKPPVVDILDSKSFYYAFNITESKGKDEEGLDVDGFAYDCLYVEGAVTKDTIIHGWIEATITRDDELKMVNEYNEYKAGLSKDITKKERYEAYLKQRAAFIDGIKLN